MIFLHFMWTLDNYLSILVFAGIAIYAFLCLIGWLFDTFIDCAIRAWRKLKSKFTKREIPTV